MNKFEKNIEAIKEERFNHDKKCTELLWQALTPDNSVVIDPLATDWPPLGITLISNEDLEANTYSSDIVDMPFVLLNTEIPEEVKVDVDGILKIDFDYIAEKGYRVSRVMSPKFQGAISMYSADTSRLLDKIKQSKQLIIDELDGLDAEYISHISLYPHIEGGTLTVFMACVILVKPTKEEISRIRLGSVHTDMLDLVKALPILNKGDETPNLKSWEWHISDKDALSVLDICNLTNNVKFPSVSDLINTNFMGIIIKSVDTDKTELRLKLDLKS
jgi:hypothetical protein